jgi:hypothetical protein
MARSSWRSSGAAVLASVLIVAASAEIGGHRKDEYLQAARIALAADRVRITLDLTAGIAVADVVLAEIDGDGTGTISDAEAAAYADVVRAAIALDVDGRILPVELADSHFPATGSIRRGEGSIGLELGAVLPRLDAGAHHLRYRNTHHPEIGAYLANVLVPEDPRVVVHGQKRDIDQRQLIVDYTLTGRPSTGGPFHADLAGALLVCAALWWRARRRRLDEESH